ncbi:MAG: arginine--tRNA ligase [bacterium]|nr:arginine--tRNA ligase [bacterium]
MKFKVETPIFEKFPNVRIGVVVALGMNNQDPKPKIGKLLEEEEARTKKELTGVDPETLRKVAFWRKAYQEFGSQSKEYRSSIEALLVRVVAGPSAGSMSSLQAGSGQALPHINPLVDLYNYISLKYMVPVGSNDLDKVKGDIVLGFATGAEKGKHLGSSKVSNCYSGEVVYKDDLGFICRRWNWRESERTKLVPETENALVVIEANPHVPESELKLALEETAKQIQENLGGQIEIKIIEKESSEFDIPFETGQKIIKKEMEELKKVEVVPERVEKTPKIINKNSFAFQLQDLIFQAASEVVGKSKVKIEDIALEHPGDLANGDYSTNIALRLKKDQFTAPMDLANRIMTVLRTRGLPSYLAKIEVAKPGFINLWLSSDFLGEKIQEVLKEKDRFGSSTIGSGKKILLEHTSPNPQTTIMLGHLRNNFLGMAASNILEFSGVKVTKDCVVNDRGVHLCRAIFGYLVFTNKKSGFNKKKLLNFREITDEQIKAAIAKANWQELILAWQKKKTGWLVPNDLKLKPDHANLIWYVLGSRAYGLEEKVKEQVEEMLLAWEAEDKAVWAIWKQILEWSIKGYSGTYKRIGSKHDWVWRESEHYKKGKKIVEEGFKKKVFRISEGAVITDLAKYNLSDTVVQKADGTALYMTQDLALTKLKIKKFPSDLYIWDIGQEQSLYFKQLFAVCEQLGIGKKDHFFHLSYALINFKGGGKMATRKGDVVKADEILDELHQRAIDIIKSSNQELRGKISKEQLEKIAETVASGAIKYSLLKFNRETTMYFDIKESLSLEGSSGPYLQYTYARCQSVLAKGGREKGREGKKDTGTSNFAPEELAIMRTIYKFPEIVEEAANNFAPNLICGYLFDLAQRYNLMYNTLPILKSSPGEKKLRLALTAATAQVLKNGLNLLGIAVLERM